MKVTLVTHSMYPDSIGGREKYVYYLADGLGKDGHEVKVLTCSSRFHPHVKKYANFTVYYYPSIDIPLKAAKYRIPVGMVWSLFKDDSDIVHAHDLHHFTTFASSIISRIKGQKVVVTEHGYPKSEGMMKNLIKFYDKTLLRIIGSASSRIIGVSGFISNELEARYHLDPSKVRTVYNAVNMIDGHEKGIDFERKYGIRGKRIILGVGRLTKEKGFQYLIAAFKSINARYPDTVLVLIGPSTQYKNFLLRFAERNGIKDRVIFTGPLEESLVKSAIRSCEIICIPSEYEPMPLIALEALHMKKPIVASRVGGLSEIFTDGKDALMVSPGNIKGLEEKISSLLSSKTLREKLMKNSRQTTKKYDWKSFLDQIVSVYEEARRN